MTVSSKPGNSWAASSITAAADRRWCGAKPSAMAANSGLGARRHGRSERPSQWRARRGTVGHRRASRGQARPRSLDTCRFAVVRRDGTDAVPPLVVQTRPRRGSAPAAAARSAEPARCPAVCALTAGVSCWWWSYVADPSPRPRQWPRPSLPPCIRPVGEGLLAALPSRARRDAYCGRAARYPQQARADGGRLAAHPSSCGSGRLGKGTPLNQSLVPFVTARPAPPRPADSRDHRDFETPLERWGCA